MEKKRMKSERRNFWKALLIAVLFVAFISVGCAFTGVAQAATITVCPSGCDYTSIQAAINAANPGDTIEVHSGTYNENVDVNKQLILRGVDIGSGKPVVDARGSGNAITLSADGIMLEEFTATNSGSEWWGEAGIKVDSNSNTVTGNNASNNQHGILLDWSSNNNTITANNASNNSKGIFLDWCDDNTFTGNTITNNGRGIYLDWNTNNNTFTGNTVSNNGYGIYLDRSNNNTITGNTVSYSSEGLYLYYSCNNNTITDNNVSNSNYNGIYLSRSSNNTITVNSVRNNKRGIYLGSSSNNTKITGNIFVNDGLFVRDSYHNTVEDNTVNGKLLVYLEDISDIEVTDAGQVILINCNNVTVENLNLSNTSVGVQLLQTDDCRISNNTVCKNTDDGIYLYSSNNNTITGNNASYSRMGMDLYSSNNNTIINNTASTSQSTGISLYYSGDNSITGNDVSNNSYGGIYLGRSTRNTIASNNASNNQDNGIYLYYSGNNSITGNDVSNNSNDGIYLFHSSINNTIAGNNASNNNGNGVYLYSSNSNTFIDNDASNNTVKGIYLHYSCNNNSIIGNNASNNSYHGIGLWESSNNNISGNNVCNNNNHGIHLSHSSTNNTVTSNNVCNNDHPDYEINGINIYRFSNNNTIIGNNISNSDQGIYVSQFSTNNTITRNNVGNNNYGSIGLWDASNNKIYLNNFNDPPSIMMHNSSNIWNSTEEITYTYGETTYENYTGNYWDDYTGSDADGDGIGDASYVIPHDNNDNYPLMEHWENYFAPTGNIFDTEAPANPYPSIMGTHNGTITPSYNINVSKLYTYACAGTGGHTESIELYNENDTLIANGSWNGYTGDYHNITIHNLTGEAPYVTLLKNYEYRYVVKTGSYPQIIHEQSKNVTGGAIACDQFIDANGKIYTGWIPAIRLWAG